VDLAVDLPGGQVPWTGAGWSDAVVGVRVHVGVACEHRIDELREWLTRQGADEVGLGDGAF
jgi:hypothetical protein